MPSLTLRGVGPGKVHSDASIVRQIEDLGYLPKITEFERQAALQTPQGAVAYIAAIMRGLADVAAKFGARI